jgi:hypothetical protein
MIPAGLIRALDADRDNLSAKFWLNPVSFSE